jgi:hypothetical protein
MKLRALTAAILALAPPHLPAQDCENLMSKVDTAVSDATSERDPETLNFVDSLRDEAAQHLGNGDTDSCVAAITQALELLEVQ